MFFVLNNFLNFKNKNKDIPDKIMLVIWAPVKLKRILGSALMNSIKNLNTLYIII